MKRPIILIITDLHLDQSNIDAVSNVTRQAIDKAKSLGLKHLYIAGDIFNSRKSQPLDLLDAWEEVITYAQSKSIVLRAIPGNHDKIDYTSERSYLDVYKHHPAFELVRDYKSFPIGKYNIHMIPFFDEKETYSKYLNKVQFLGNDILITHVAIDGVRNNDGSVIEDILNTSIFKKFLKVFVGHYHDKQQIDNVVFYIGALLQKNYGEDDQKGFTVMYEDGTHEMIVSEFTKYETIKIDLDTATQQELIDLRRDYKGSTDNIRFKFTGSKEKVTALDKSKFDDLGIDIKCEYKDVDVEVDYASATSFSGFDRKKIKEEWIEFCKKNDDIEEKIGFSYLEKIL
jgi:exonuclease SbcD